MQGPLKEASKFASQLSGAVNKKVMEIGDPLANDGGDALEAAEAATAAGVGMAQGWKPPTNQPGVGQELANDVPSELSIDEQVYYARMCGGGRLVSLRIPVCFCLTIKWLRPLQKYGDIPTV